MSISDTWMGFIGGAIFLVVFVMELIREGLYGNRRLAEARVRVPSQRDILLARRRGFNRYDSPAASRFHSERNFFH